MIVVAVDANVLIGELLRRRGRDLFANPGLRSVVTEDQWAETEHELAKRLATIVSQGRLTADQASNLKASIRQLVDEEVIYIVLRSAYAHVERIARRRIPADPNDWPTVALALVMACAILTHDKDFLGCGCPTWTVETIGGELRAQAQPAGN